MDYTYLGKLHSREELRALDAEACKTLCGEIRQELVERVTQNGGHLASNLGVVELTLALHRVFDLPEERVIFDVGHQSYVHKLLSDRFDRFDTLRKPGGISGFQRRDESPYDAFGGGHASTSLSAALGFAEAEKLNGGKRFTVAVVGDGAFTGGMIHEAFNNCSEDLPLIIVLNENEMSISKNTGRFARIIGKLRSTKGYFWMKRKVKKVLSVTKLGRRMVRNVSRLKMRIKRAMYADNYFEQIGINYLGPIDGHNLKKLETVLREAKQDGGCSLIHVRTVKGKGYPEAEEDPGKFHGVPPAEHESVPTFSQHFGEKLTEMAKEDRRICAITAAMADGTGLVRFGEEYPDRFFDVGIAEEHAMTFAAALSAAGMKPVYAVYATFAQRCFDQMIHDAALQRIPVTMAIDRAGLAVADGPTHHGVYDVSMAFSLPESEIFAPLTFDALDEFLENAIDSDKMTFIRYRSGGECKRIGELPYIYKEGSLRGALSDEPDGLILTYGALSEEALRAKDEAEKEGKAVSVIAIEKLRPDDETLKKILAIDDPFKTFEKDKTPYETHGISFGDMLKALR